MAAVTDPEDHALLICTLIDGSVVTLSSESGNLSAFFSTGRDLVSTRSNGRVVPDLEGKLYWKRTMQMLPLTIDEILQSPVQTCVEDDTTDGTECGIVTGAKLTSLYGIDTSSGSLVWTSHSTTPVSTSSGNIAVLQREDYMVQHISTSTGRQFWNVTLGRFSALSFETSSSSSSSSPTLVEPNRFMIDDDGIDETLAEEDSDTVATSSRRQPPTAVPLIEFDTTGRVLTLLDQDTQQVRWRRELPQVIARVYGLQAGAWVPLTVVEEPSTELLQNDDDDMPVQQLLLPPSNREDELYQLLLQQQYIQISKWQDKSVGLYNPPQRLLTASSGGKQTLTEQTHVRVQDGAKKASSETELTLLHLEGENMCVHPLADGFQPTSVGVPSVQPPKYYVPAFPPAQRVSGGLFLTWPILAGILLTAIAGACALFWLYLSKKHKWLLESAEWTPVISHRQTPSDMPPRLELDRNLSVPLESHRNTTHVKRSLSLPAFMLDKNANNRDDGDRSVYSSLPDHQLLSMQQKSSPTLTTNPSTLVQLQLERQLSPMLKSQPESLEGIPLVRYSRYRSEFREIAPLGKGGFGSVFECQNLLDGRKYAIKKVPIQLFDDPQLTRDRLQRVLREVKILALLDHPNIVRYYTAWMEVEENNDDNQEIQGQGDGDGNCDGDEYTSSRYLSRCYSSSLLTSNLVGERPSQMGKAKKKESPQPNPLGWNAFGSEISQLSLFKRDSVESLEDYGFHVERTESEMNDAIGDRTRGHQNTDSKADVHTPRKTVQFDVIESQDHSSSSSSSSSSSWSDGKSDTKGEKSEVKSDQKSKEPTLRHILYIQMQLCGQKTLANFLSNPKARKTTNGAHVDVHYALKLFHHVAMGVKYVHSQDLIHRDLKPNNCFLDDSGIVKVGDFGLSRETNNDMDESIHGDDGSSIQDDEQENTAGVGTRAYASPEQINGSDYDSATDIFSLGFILFELTFEMTTGMERHIMFSRLRQREIPEEWTTKVAASFPILHSMLYAMVSPIPSDRPSADDVVRLMEKLLGEFTVQSLDQSLQDQSSMLLRVEAEPTDGVLNRTIQLIKDVASGVKIDQYGLRSGESNTIIEFALSGTDQAGLARVLEAMEACPDIKLARQVSNKNTAPRDLPYSANDYSRD